MNNKNCLPQSRKVSYCHRSLSQSQPVLPLSPTCNVWYFIHQLRLALLLQTADSWLWLGNVCTVWGLEFSQAVVQILFLTGFWFQDLQTEERWSAVGRFKDMFQDQNVQSVQYSQFLHWVFAPSKTDRESGHGAGISSHLDRSDAKLLTELEETMWSNWLYIYNSNNHNNNNLYV